MSYGAWVPFRMCNGYKSDAGKWGVMYQEKPNAEIKIAQRQSGGHCAFVNKERAQAWADKLNNEVK